MPPRYRFGDVVEVEYPYTDFSGEKVRPAVVISSDQYNQALPQLILLPITGSTWIEGRIFGTVEVLDPAAANLSKESVIKAAPHTVDVGKVKRRGTLDKTTRARLTEALKKFFPR